ncbi:43444_t:CDS:2 [Gigaspora margarita]|uniref:43444_t:CDS:1 n=1 Tax=Gigaspora margarita TaxID=4874 RepID=A0ABN7UMQ4_GIGMA|nr:43444_t:CDS:2 [Gigaspora margarita]
MSVGIDMPTFQSSTSEDVQMLIDDNFNDTVTSTTPPFQFSIGVEKNIPPLINNEYDAKGQNPFTSFMNRRNTPPLINNDDPKGQTIFTSFRNTPKNIPPPIKNKYDSKEKSSSAPPPPQPPPSQYIRNPTKEPNAAKNLGKKLEQKT